MKFIDLRKNHDFNIHLHILDLPRSGKVRAAESVVVISPAHHLVPPLEAGGLVRGVAGLHVDHVGVPHGLELHLLGAGGAGGPAVQGQAGAQEAAEESEGDAGVHYNYVYYSSVPGVVCDLVTTVN